MHLAHPSGNDWGKRRVKNDERDARDLADLLRLGRLAEAWIAPPAVRELRELVRYRAKLVQLRSGLKAQVHAVMAKEGVLPTVHGHVRCPAGQRQLDAMELGRALHDPRRVAARPHRALRPRGRHARAQDPPAACATTTAIRPSRPSTASAAPSPRSSSPRSATSPGSAHAEALCSWAGLTPAHRESDTKVVRGGITKLGSRLVRWAALEAHGPLPRRALAARATSIASPSDGARTRPAWRSPARCSRSSTTACATARSAACAPTAEAA